MNRAEAREKTFARDRGKCVFCGDPAVDAHHLIERRLWHDGGYHLDNLISVCYTCHMLCEMTLYSIEDGREAAGITNVIVPEHLYADTRYDKWGNPLLEDLVTKYGSVPRTRPITGGFGEPLWQEYQARARGELFWDESVQRILKEGDVMKDFTSFVKYPRTYHLPWSNPSKDDRVLKSLDAFVGKEIVVTEKMDGENTTLYNNYMHARSIDSGNHQSRAWVKQFWAQMGYEIPEGMRVCGENLYAKHSIHYTDLSTYFMGFSVWDENVCLSWDDTQEWFSLLGITPVPVLYRGVWNERELRILADAISGSRCVDCSGSEGYVARVADAFTMAEFRYKVGKYVRPNHITTDAHWRNTWITNTLDKST